ncbi:Golgi membrane protein 1 isoform X3 [Pantherophis guttatus]|nr:Golgi membrane protein 1 isoform X3 [Pantherophis guttatus]XP_034266009.1 Golgi membrane protein 1 isoform X3 [Pantherophis guttatus]XP_034266011.1 Golgi membrane protein 1 isoform X3 [Pantherophis guttatus]XP_060546550.1 Golgi membrane protein 1 isoform X3 [Pantherophis guttatus]
MVGLGNSRRGIKSPPLLVAALVACIIVLGFNYWIASSRSVDLQNRLMELEGRMRRAAAERGAVEMKKNEFQGELKKQREQIDKIQSMNDFQIENINKIHRGEKEILLNNITLNGQLIQNLQENLKKLQRECEKLQLDVNRFQNNQTNLQRKFSFDMSKCLNKMEELKEQCEEKLKASPEDSKIQQEKKKEPTTNISEKNQANIQMQNFGETEIDHHDLTNQESELQKKNTPNEFVKLVSRPISVLNKEELNQHRVNGTSDVPNEESRKEEVFLNQGHLQIPSISTRDHKALPPEPEPELSHHEQIRNVLGEASVEIQTNKFSELIGHQNVKAANEVEEIEREDLLNDDLQQDDQETNKNGELEIKRVGQDNKGTDYNLDTNEAESETDKQAALIGQQNSFNVRNLGRSQNGKLLI